MNTQIPSLVEDSRYKRMQDQAIHQNQTSLGIVLTPLEEIQASNNTKSEEADKFIQNGAWIRSAETIKQEAKNGELRLETHQGIKLRQELIKDLLDRLVEHQDGKSYLRKDALYDLNKLIEWSKATHIQPSQTPAATPSATTESSTPSPTEAPYLSIINELLGTTDPLDLSKIDLTKLYQALNKESKTLEELSSKSINWSDKQGLFGGYLDALPLIDTVGMIASLGFSRKLSFLQAAENSTRFGRCFKFGLRGLLGMNLIGTALIQGGLWFGMKYAYDEDFKKEVNSLGSSCFGKLGSGVSYAWGELSNSLVKTVN